MSLPLPSPRRPRRRRPVLLAAAAAALAAVLAAVLLYRPAPGQAPGQPPPRQPNKEGRVPARAPGTPGPGTVSTAGWHGVTLDGAVLPASARAGPLRGPWPLASGFADTPAGAVLAAVNVAVRASGQLGPAIFTATISAQVTGPGAGALLAAARQDYAQASVLHPPARPGGPAGVASASPRAFRLLSFTPAAAAVEVLATAGGQAAAVRLQVRWLDSDWRLVAPAGGNLAAVAVRPAGLSGYQLLPGR
jgi:hypothetical protein